MNTERYQELIGELCHEVNLPDAQAVIARGSIEVEGFYVALQQFETDPQAMYLNFDFGIVTAGRTMATFQLLLEANITVYAQDQAQMGLNPDTGGILLIVRVPFAPEVNGPWLAETLTHYIEHGRYWRDNMLAATEEMFEGMCEGNYLWLRA